MSGRPLGGGDLSPADGILNESIYLSNLMELYSFKRLNVLHENYTMILNINITYIKLFIHSNIKFENVLGQHHEFGLC